MGAFPRHQCFVYSGSPSQHLAGLALQIRRKLGENYRCLYLNSPQMVDGIRAYLISSGLDVGGAEARKQLTLSSDRNHLVDGAFDPQRMLACLKQTFDRAIRDGYTGLWASGDIAWEFGPAADFSRLEEYERGLDALFLARPTMIGVCQYHADSLPGAAVECAHACHPGIYIGEMNLQPNERYRPA